QSTAPILPETPYDYINVVEEAPNFILPSNLVLASNSPGVENVVVNIPDCNNCDIPPQFNINMITSDDIATLGRVLFYDKALSKNNSISCASCHKQELAFADDQKLSQGFGGKSTTRNSMTIANPILNTTFFWDGRSNHLRDLVLRPILDHVEMGIDDLHELSEKVIAQDYYKELFTRAYGSDEVNTNKIADAMAQFTASIFKGDSKFDKGLENNFQDFSELERHGLALFFSSKTQCASCHSGANFSAPTGFNNPYQETAGTANIGLNTIYDDNGFGEGKFKIPSLRNIAQTGPYMHDGRFETLREVLDHYNNGINPHDQLDAKFLANGSPIKMGLTDLDLEAMEAFLNTLSSATITTDERFSNPFKS
ncbi:MAG: hypothetical protein KJN84_01185, partial [Bacteroidia bacterium]|nr:hypothetical protein [Bacteroidia bacterium]